MKRSMLHNWEGAIDLLCGDKADEMFKIAEDIYNTAYVRGKNAKEWELLEQEPCEDCISREAVENITWEEPNYTDAINVLAEVRDKVRALPSVKPKTGHWIETGNMGHIDIDNVILYQEMCDKCKGLSYFRKSADKLIGARNCPNCGAKMEG